MKPNALKRGEKYQFKIFKYFKEKKKNSEEVLDINFRENKLSQHMHLYHFFRGINFRE